MSGRLSAPLCFPFNATLLIQYVLDHLSKTKTFPLARVYQHTSATGYLELELSLTYYGRRARLSPRAMAPSTKKKNSGLANPRWWMNIER